MVAEALPLSAGLAPVIRRKTTHAKTGSGSAMIGRAARLASDFERPRSARVIIPKINQGHVKKRIFVFMPLPFIVTAEDHSPAALRLAAELPAILVVTFVALSNCVASVSLRAVLDL